MKKKLAVLVLGLGMVPLGGQAQDLSYNYVEGGLAVYPSASIHSIGSQDYVGIDVRGSLALDQIAENVFAISGLKYLSDDVDLTAFHIGGGYRLEMEPGTEIWGALTVEYQDFDIPQAGSDSDTALGLRTGIRHQATRDIEVGGSLRLVTGDADYLGLTGTMRYAIQDNLHFLGEIDLYDGELGLIGGVTLDF